MRGLRARWNQRALAPSLGPRTRGTVAEGEDVGIARGLQRRRHDELIAAARFQSVELGKPLRRLDARRPHDKVRGVRRAARGLHGFGVDVRHTFADAHLYVQLLEEPGRRLGEMLGELRQDPRRGFDDGKADVLRRIEVLESVAGKRPGRVADFRRELHARRPGPDDHDAHANPMAGTRFDVRPHACSEKTPMKPLGVLLSIERDGVVGDTRNPEVIAHTPDAEYERVVMHRALRQHERAVVVVNLVERKRMLRAIESSDGPQPEHEAVPVG